MLIRFTDITEYLKYPPSMKGTLSSYHSSIILYAAQNFVSTRKFRRQVINTINTITYHVLQGNELPSGWSESTPILEDNQQVDEFECKDTLGNMFISESDIEWDVDEISEPVPVVSNFTPPVDSHIDIPVAPVEKQPTVEAVINTPVRCSNIEDLSIQPPMYPQVDFSKPWFSRLDRNMGITFAIYPSIPQIPTTQREISMTTDVSLIPEYALLDLFPAQVMQTRGSDMYEPVSSLDWDKDLGTILPIKGFTTKQLKDNIVKYPHLYKLTRLVDGKQIAFHKMIEIDGVLHNTLDVWDSLPDTKNIPKTSAFVKEYVVRRYLLERDINGLVHTSTMYGDLSPFLTLFMPAASYIKFGYKDAVDLAKRCVTARVAYKQSRSPVLRRFADE